ncbi:chitinase [Cellulosimicrobium sp. 72-3]|uniref:chitinase n=1 Tax=Cellulosimicrobium sp. 72-3 TaxID=2731680 RepID=UPI0020A49627|nr:chitinase [Cellulosimicrobium sp. 72-3]
MTDPTTTTTTAPTTFVVTEQQFDAMFPERNPFYTYAGLVAATVAYPAFATSGGDRVARREAAAFLAQVSHETHGLEHVVEVNTANYPHYCDPAQPYGCPAGQDAYYGRGPLQLSWNFNYRAAGEALGIDLLADPWLVEQDPTVAWQTALWYWNTQPGTASMTCHDAIVGEHGFAETIRSINGPLECEGGNPRQMNNRVRLFRHYVEIVGTTTGDHLTC